MAFTFFFRDLQILELAVKHTVAATSGFSKVRVWDAGCAMGPEPYSLAIIFAENMGKFAFRNLTIDATDINESENFGDIIKEGRYPKSQLERSPEGLFEKYFIPTEDPNIFEIREDIKNAVKYSKHDLLSLQPIGNNFSLILCKNVLLHFQYNERVEVIKMFHKSLLPGGFLATEQTQKLPPEVEHLFERVVADGQLFRKI